MSSQLRALEHPIVLDLTFQFAGVKEWLFVGAVCKAWAAVHSSKGSSSLHGPGPQHRKLTRYGAVTTLGCALYASSAEQGSSIRRQ
jgi:hypothetical protein